MTILRAHNVITMAGPPIRDGAVRIEGSRIAAAGPAHEIIAEGGAVTDLGDVTLLPGLINAHCHLDYSMLRGAIMPQHTFTAWIERINAIKRTLDADDYLAGISRGFAELQRWGTTSVANIEAFPELMPRMPASPIRTWWFYEMIDVRHRITTEDVVAGALTFFDGRRGALDRFGLSPHAPYTASAMLYRLANDSARGSSLVLTTHVAESREEWKMFRQAKGALHDFLARIGRPMGDCGRDTPFGALWRSGAIGPGWLLAHMNELDDADFELLASLPPGDAPHIVHCPGSHAYFGHSPFHYRRLAELGVNVSIGTDSLASTDSLSLLGELRRFWKKEPQLAADALLRMVTVNAARALGCDGTLGVIAPGAHADLIALPAEPSEDVHEAVVRFAKPIPWMMIDGSIVA